MDEFIIQILRGDATPSVTERVRRWRDESPENEAQFRSVARVWSLTEPAAGREHSRPVDLDVILMGAEARREAQDSVATIPISIARRRFTFGRHAAGWSVALAAGIAAIALGIRMDVFTPGPRPTASYLAQASTPTTVSLDDGSFVKLAAGSRLEVWYSEDERRVSLHGRGFFAVAHQAGRPFIVESRGTETQVLGTRFEVSETGGEVRTVVVDGRVALSNESGSVEVSAGSLGRATDGIGPTTETPPDIYGLLDWPTGLMLFQSTPLDRVAAEVGRRFGRALEVQGEDVGALRISGTFEEESFEEVVLALCETVGAECALTEQGATIGR